MSFEIISRAEAVRGKKKFYFTGIPCRREHIAQRRVSSNNCLECEKIVKTRYYAENRERKKAYQAQWRDSNPDKVKEQWKASVNTPEKRALTNYRKRINRRKLSGIQQQEFHLSVVADNMQTSMIALTEYLIQIDWLISRNGEYAGSVKGVSGDVVSPTGLITEKGLKRLGRVRFGLRVDVKRQLSPKERKIKAGMSVGMPYSIFDVGTEVLNYKAPRGRGIQYIAQCLHNLALSGYVIFDPGFRGKKSGYRRTGKRLSFSFFC